MLSLYANFHYSYHILLLRTPGTWWLSHGLLLQLIPSTSTAKHLALIHHLCQVYLFRSICALTQTVLSSSPSCEVMLRRRHPFSSKLHIKAPRGHGSTSDLFQVPSAISGIREHACLKCFIANSLASSRSIVVAGMLNRGWSERMSLSLQQTAKTVSSSRPPPAWASSSKFSISAGYTSRDS